MLAADDDGSQLKEGLIESTKKKWQYVMDKLSPQIALRWSIFTATFFIYLLRVYVVNGWYIVTYALGIYLLNQMIGFLSPQFDPEENDGDMDLPTREQEEYRFVFDISELNLRFTLTKFCLDTSNNKFSFFIFINQLHHLFVSFVTFTISGHLLDDFQSLNFGMHVLEAL